MADIFSRKARSRMMSSVKHRGSKIEKEVGDILRANGIRYRSHSGTLPGKPDFYFTKQKIVIFVDSCFWHGCRYHGSIPKSHTVFWRKKILRNRERDREINKTYRKMGWRVLRIWQHTLKKEGLPSQFTNILGLLRRQ